MTRQRKRLVPPSCLLAPACQRLWLVDYDDASNESSHVLAVQSTLAPDRRDVSSRALASRFLRSSFEEGYVVRGLLDGSLPYRPTS